MHLAPSKLKSISMKASRGSQQQNTICFLSPSEGSFRARIGLVLGRLLVQVHPRKLNLHCSSTQAGHYSSFGSSISATGMMGLRHSGNRAKWKELVIPRKAVDMTQSQINCPPRLRGLGQSWTAQLFGEARVSPGSCSRVPSRASFSTLPRRLLRHSPDRTTCSLLSLLLVTKPNWPQKTVTLINWNSTSDLTLVPMVPPRLFLWPRKPVYVCIEVGIREKRKPLGFGSFSSLPSCH